MTTNNNKAAGRKPLPTAATTQKQPGGFFSQDILHVDAALDKEIRDQGLEYRWIDAREFSGAGNFHKNYWVPYRRPTAAKSDSDILLKYGNDPEGFIRRKSLVLATRPTEIGDDHRFTLKQKAKSYHGDLRARQAEQLRDTVRQSGVKASVIDDPDGEDN